MSKYYAKTNVASVHSDVTEEMVEEEVDGVHSKGEGSESEHHESRNHGEMQQELRRSFCLFALQANFCAANFLPSVP